MSTNTVAAGRKGDAIFVNARPSSKNEKDSIQRLVRAHVGRWISDQTKERSPAEGLPDGQARRDSSASRSPMPRSALLLNSPSPPRSPPASATHSDSGQSVPPVPLEQIPLRRRAASKRLDFPQPIDSDGMNMSPAPSWASREQSLDGSPDEQAEPTRTQNPDRHASPPDRMTPGYSGYIENFSCQVVDPFCQNPLSYFQKEVSDTEEYCLRVLWPGLTPVSPGQETSPSSSNWLPLALKDRTLFTAFVFGSLSHKRLRWVNGWIGRDQFKPEEQRILQICEMETIQNVTREVSDPTRAVCDAVILSVICMAHNVAEDHGRAVHQTTPFDAPLQRLQWLDIYGGLPPNLVHIKGLVQMVRLRGGLQNLSLPGLAATLSFSDIVTCSTFLMPPVFPFMSLRQERRGIHLQELLGYTPVDVDRRHGPLRDIGLTPELVEVIYAMHLYTNIVENHLRTHVVNPDYSLLSDQRNLVHYTLLSIPSASQLDGFAAYQPHEVIYEACRIAALIFGVGVVFPLPAQSTPLAQLAKLIQNVVQLSDVATTWNHPQARIVLFWVLILGGIAADDQPERSWFVQIISQAAASHGIGTWDDARKLLGLMLWYDRACDKAGRELWQEAKHSFVKMEELTPPS
ncbi:hypothetical protein BO70DRAFT_397954 [Aspergillus heteromorphus CBS 117.55]|uniref:Uncharacterized protein n=1 Tax=Aspergillus heteromorphus CBS 117.55 TaxID=1448321 RepID=A0A317VRW3_9EURO|nr:uncharacterized protein BO70DRAFT_397954 [Aspergillus heteromorphus CBS 117.55]PWY77066.1 hypothetical protein BO70DRAFT_397954 [Aspergillus heteromorphus CBS 117.55]